MEIKQHIQKRLKLNLILMSLCMVWLFWPVYLARMKVFTSEVEVPKGLNSVHIWQSNECRWERVSTV